MAHRQAVAERCTAPPHNRSPQSIPSLRPPPSTSVSSPAAGADLHSASRGGAGVLLLPPHHRSPVSILIHPIRPRPRPRIPSPRPPLAPIPILRAEVAPGVLLLPPHRRSPGVSKKKREGLVKIGGGGGEGAEARKDGVWPEQVVLVHGVFSCCGGFLGGRSRVLGAACGVPRVLQPLVRREVRQGAVAQGRLHWRVAQVPRLPRGTSGRQESQANPIGIRNVCLLCPVRC